MKGDTPTTDVEEQIIEAMARAIFATDTTNLEWQDAEMADARDGYRLAAAAAFTAALAARSEDPCPTEGCDEGDVGPRDERGEGFWKDCPTCSGTGTVPGAPLLVLREQLEQVGVRYSNGEETK